MQGREREVDQPFYASGMVWLQAAMETSELFCNRTGRRRVGGQDPGQTRASLMIGHLDPYSSIASDATQVTPI